MEPNSCWKVQDANDGECSIRKTPTAHSGDPEGNRYYSRLFVAVTHSR
jgi:hypothetical protein